LDWIQLALQGLADSAIAEKPPVVCPDFGQPGWAPFCFLNGNPVFNTFDQFQTFIQSSVVELHDFLQVIVLYVFLKHSNYPCLRGHLV
jgi:hypothetical protein